MARLSVPPEADEAQRRSSDPLGSAWVSANAGAGKTYVLSQRVVRLLLSGVEPQGILCLTYTNAAAAEMAGRVFRALAVLTALPDESLLRAVANLAPQLDAEKAAARARTLFARTLETPGGLKVATVHAFAAALLRQFPMEANVSGAFAILDDPTREELTDKAINAVLSEAQTAPDGLVADAINAALPHVADGELAKALKGLLADYPRLAAWLRGQESATRLGADLRRALAVQPAPPIPSPAFTEDSLRELAQHARRLKAGRVNTDAVEAIAAAQTVDERDTLMRPFVLKADGEPKSASYLFSKALREELPWLTDTFQAEQARQQALLPITQAEAVVEATVPLVQLAWRAGLRVERDKRRRGLLDYDDQIQKAVDLLKGQSAAAWVRYRLDEGIDHILLDEAQDTSPAQWELVRALTDEFYDGAGAREEPRTLFVVGDEKQSIYSFQGAAPQLFAQKRDDYAQRAVAAGQRFETVSLAHSFRSAPQVLAAVDAVFADAALAAAVGADKVRHAPVKELSGGVDVWPLLSDEEDETPLAWDAPLDARSESAGEKKLAIAIADQIEAWMRAGPDGGPPVSPGGVMVLSRKRGRFTQAMNRELKVRGIPAAGPDRLSVTEHIAVKDMVALARALLSPDDLSLAAVLKSPLFGFSEEALFAVAHDREGSLMEALARTQEGRAAHETLARWRRLVRHKRPFDAFCAVLIGEGRRADFAARMGAEAEDALDAFLDLALSFEDSGIAAMEPFLMRLSKLSTDIRRSNDGTDDKVRVMTVHGAKGLEADVVFLADVGASVTRTGRSGPEFAALPLGEDAEVLALTPRKSAQPPVLAEVVAARQAAEAAEHNRLLYVGMTRAERFLVVCGAFGKREPGEGMWHASVSEALEPGSSVRPGPLGDVLAWRTPAADAVEETPEHGTPRKKPLEIPGWLSAPAPAIVRPPEPLAPSDGEKVAVSAPAGSARHIPAARYGALVHALIEAPGDLAEMTERAIRLERGLPEDIAQAMAQEATAALALPELAAERVLSEVGVIGDVLMPGGTIRRAHGRVDRIQIGDEALIVDFKTDRAPPHTPQEVPAAYLRQLAIYKALIAPQLGVTVRTAIVWTATPTFMALDNVLPSVSPASASA